MKSRKATIENLVEAGMSEENAAVVVQAANESIFEFARRQNLIHRMRSEPDKSRRLKGIQVRHVDTPIKRNAQCPCGSGLKFKKCCLKKERQLGVVVHREGENGERNNLS